MKTLLLILTLTLSAFADCRTLHGREFYANIRISAPAQLTNWDGHKLDYVVSDEKSVVVTSIDFTDFTEFPKDFGKTYKDGKWWLFTCADNGELLWVAKVLPPTSNYTTRKK